MKTTNEIRPIKKSVEANLLKRPGVTGVDIGFKYVNGKKTDTLAIRIYVKKKKDVSAKNRIPKTIQGVKTDVIEREFVLHPLMVRVDDLELKADTATHDPLRGGISIGPCRSVYLNDTEAACHGGAGAGWYTFVGTLGAFVRDNATDVEMMLSNFHVMCVDDGWSVGDTIAQPSLVDTGTCPTDVIGSLQRASLGGQVDCAVTNHTARAFNASIVDIGWVNGTAEATTSMAVRKRGRTTGLTYGVVDTVDLSVTINYCNGLGSVTLTDQIGIDVDSSQSAQFGDSGDSGSVVVDDARNVVGLYFAANSAGTYGVANPIQSVLTALDVRMAVSVLKKYEPDKSIWSEVEQRKPEWRKPEQWKPEQDKPEWHKPEQWKPEQDKPEWHKPEQYKPERQKPEQYKPEQAKPEGYKPEQHKPEQYKPERQKPEQYKYDEPPGTDQPWIGEYGRFEERLARLESAISQLNHFIGPDLRPDLSRGALQKETDIGES